MYDRELRNESVTFQRTKVARSRDNTGSRLSTLRVVFSSRARLVNNNNTVPGRPSCRRNAPRNKRTAIRSRENDTAMQSGAALHQAAPVAAKQSSGRAEFRGLEKGAQERAEKAEKHHQVRDRRRQTGGKNVAGGVL